MVKAVATGACTSVTLGNFAGQERCLMAGKRAISLGGGTTLVTSDFTSTTGVPKPGAINSYRQFIDALARCVVTADH